MPVRTGRSLSWKLVLVASSSAASLLVLSHPAHAVSQDEVLRRLDALEKRNERLAKENAELRVRVHNIEGAKGTVQAVAAPGKFKGNPVLHAGVATSPEVAAPALVSVAGYPLITKGDRPPNALVDNTTVTLYGHADVSLDAFNVGVYDQGNKYAIGSNISYFGVRARHNLDAYGYSGWAFIGQYENLVEISSTPSERAAFGSRDSYVGVEGPYGAIKLGKSDTPYKRATSAFDPFSATIGDYNSIMGNTGGDTRAEFDYRAPHSIWYESPIVAGFQFSALASPGQNTGRDNQNFPYGEFNCSGSSPRGSGSGFPSTSQGFSSATTNGNFIGTQTCTDGSFGDLYSANIVFKNGPFTGIAAGEFHSRVNRTSDEFNPDGSRVVLPNGQTVIGVGVKNEYAAKVGLGYRIEQAFGGPLQLYGIYEVMRRENTNPLFNERSRDGVFASATQSLGPNWSVFGSYTHAFRTPGSPGTGVLNNTSSANTETTTQVNFNALNDSASMYAVGTRYRFSQWASWYLVGALLDNGPGAHFCLGASGHNYTLCGRDQFNQTVVNAKIKAVSTGLTLDF